MNETRDGVEGLRGVGHVWCGVCQTAASNTAKHATASMALAFLSMQSEFRISRINATSRNRVYTEQHSIRVATG
jgi:hypothetical protein